MVVGWVVWDMLDRGGLLIIFWFFGFDKKVLKKFFVILIGNDIGYFKYIWCRG